MPADARSRFDDDVFTYRVTKDGKVLIYTDGRLVTTVAGNHAGTLIKRIESSDRREVQHLLATATGNYKHGTERRS